MPDVTLAIDGASLVGGLTAAGTAVAGGILGAVKLMLAYLRRKDVAGDKLISRFLDLSLTWQQESKAVTAALTEVRDGLERLAERVDRIDGRKQ